jgi:SAM-dependent methyltransferase
VQRRPALLTRSVMPAPTGWLSYDSVADTYERVAVPWFTALARDLVAAVRAQPGERLLDIGTGTGLAAIAALTTEATVTAVGVDPSRGMLAKVDSARIARVSAMAPGLPFPPASFDAAIANLCVSHLSATRPPAAVTTPARSASMPRSSTKTRSSPERNSRVPSRCGTGSATSPPPRSATDEPAPPSSWPGHRGSRRTG